MSLEMMDKRQFYPYGSKKVVIYIINSIENIYEK